ncbi:MAG TPA: hypothetical protein PLI27_09800 [Ignavibacteriales bacterium]|nr:hypothetical protein [Ignavibacteriales bacterium]HOL80773.1 hypothetical protein [Ignavibacteriales bacterium]HOM66019.1 hypothetical protein [Ignavibacteriales bacterium]HPD68354.1 hypothetical protein [Ignavibacteriales bacterium]HPP33209.1 hypothetical protein [Ignavibacteriales bacterium]
MQNELNKKVLTPEEFEKNAEQKFNQLEYEFMKEFKKFDELFEKMINHRNQHIQINSNKLKNNKQIN